MLDDEMALLRELGKKGQAYLPKDVKAPDEPTEQEDAGTNFRTVNISHDALHAYLDEIETILIEKNTQQKRSCHARR